MNVIPMFPGIYRHTSCPAKIDTISHLMLAEVMSDLVTVRDLEPDPNRAAMLKSITTRLGRVLTRFEVEHQSEKN
jgi:hypothetical protein